MAKKEKTTDQRIADLEGLLEDLEYLCGETSSNNPAEILERLTSLVQAVRCLTRIIKLERASALRTANEASCLANGIKAD